MAKNRNINELRQTKDAHYVHPTFQGGDFIKPTNKPAKTTGEIMNLSKYTENDLEQAKCSIAEKITKHFQDILFEEVSNEMGNNYLFQSDNYLTEAGYDMFEDEWFEFYHEHHGDIMHQVMQNITN
tara:strand:- start:121 stop:498 length:378 start_codon:yes stop_codon:yes gene_type:complete